MGVVGRFFHFFAREGVSPFSLDPQDPYVLFKGIKPDRAVLGQFVDVLKLRSRHRILLFELRMYHPEGGTFGFCMRSSYQN